MPSMLPVSSACSDIRRRGEFIEHPLDASALGCASVCPLCAPISAVPLLALNAPKRMSIWSSRYGMAPQAPDDVAFADLVRLAGS